MNVATVKKLEEIRERLESGDLDEAALPLQTAFGNLSLVLERMAKDLKIATNMTHAMLKRVKKS